MKNVAVFFGGRSTEKEISVITGVLTVNSLDKTKYNVYPIFIDKNGKWFTGKSFNDLTTFSDERYKKGDNVSLILGDDNLYIIKGKKLKKICRLNCVINCLHGEGGEDGSLSGIISSCFIPLASPDILPSSISMDKSITKLILKGLNIRCLPSVTVKSVKESEKRHLGFSYPVIVKPSCGGSSIGIIVAKDYGEMLNAVRYVLTLDKKVIIEPCITDYKEINCACYKDGNKNLTVSQCERPIGRTDILTFSDKYENGKRIFPADISVEESEKIQEITKKVYKALDFSGVIRIDYFIYKGIIYLNEINSVPGSLSYYLFSKDENGFKDMLDRMIINAENEFKEKEGKKRDFNSDILSGKKGVKYSK